MKHPFEGIIGADGGSLSEAPLALRDADSHRAGRRSFFLKVLAVCGGAVAAIASRYASAQQFTDQGIHGDVTSRSPSQWRKGDSGKVTTQAVGEEGGGEGRVTTYALGEEGARHPGGWYPQPPRPGPVTTQAMGEEGGYYRTPWGRWWSPGYRPPRYRYPPSNRYTTQALGEEGGWWR